MKLTGLLLYTLFFSWVACAQNKGYHIEVKVKNLPNSQAQLAYYFEDKQYLVADGKTNEKGIVTFKGDEKLPTGLYILFFPESNLFLDLIVSEDQEFVIDSEKDDFTKKLRISGSADNKAFLEYQVQMSELVMQQQTIDTLAKYTQNPDSVKWCTSEHEKLQKAFAQTNKIAVEQNEETFFADILLAMNAAEISGDAMWDAVNFNQAGLIRTPFFYRLIRMHIGRYIEMPPQVINQKTDLLMSKAKVNDEMYRYIAGYLLNFYRSFTKVGMNEVFVHIAETYFLQGKASWIEPSGLKLIAEQTEIFKASMPGQTARNVKLATLTGDSLSLHHVNARVTLVFFWSTGCGHCTTAIDGLKQYYAVLKSKNIEIIGVNIDAGSMEQLNKHMAANPVAWTTCTDIKNASRYKEYYYVASSPIMYVLDDKKVIRNKLIGELQIVETAKLLSEN